jgi:hypothetical protein
MKTRPPLDVQAASRFASRVRLSDLVCIEIEARHLTVPASAETSTLSWDLKNPHARWRSEEREISVLFPFAITIERKEERRSRTDVVADIKLVYQVLYIVEQLEAAEMAELPHYIGVSGFMHVWPYVRAEVQCITSKLRLPPLILPVVVSGHAAQIVTVSAWVSAESSRVPTQRAKARRKAKKIIG